jgi:hypothetical protein
VLSLCISFAYAYSKYTGNIGRQCWILEKGGGVIA